MEKKYLGKIPKVKDLYSIKIYNTDREHLNTV